jgi:O-antigen/teichoic acid export membrane protein
MAAADNILTRLRNRLPDGPVATRVARGTAWSMVGSVVVQALTTAAIIWAGRLLGPGGLGRLALLQVTFGMLASLTGAGMAATVVRLIAENRRKDPDAAGRILGLSLLLYPGLAVLAGAALAAAAPWVASVVLDAPDLTVGLQCASILLVVHILKSLQTAVLAGLEAFRAIAVLSIARGLAVVPLVVGGAILGGPVGALTGLTVVTTLDLVLTGFLSGRKARAMGIRIRLRITRTEWAAVRRHAVPAFLCGAIIGPVLWASNAMLTQRAGLLQVGLFAAATKFHRLLGMVEKPLGTVLLPVLSSSQGRCQGRAGRANVAISWALGVFPALVLICLPETLGLAFGREYATVQAYRTLSLTMCYCAVVMFKQGVWRLLVARSRMWLAALDNGIWAAVLLPAAWWLSPYGAPGLAGAFLLAYAATMCVMLPVYRAGEIGSRAVLTSLEAGTVWAVLLGATCLVWIGAGLAVRLTALAVGLGVLAGCYLRMLRPMPAQVPAESTPSLPLCQLPVSGRERNCA